MAEPLETTCTRCGTACLDYRQVGEERVCILCVAGEARREERAACTAALEAEAAYLMNRAKDCGNQRSQAHRAVGFREQAKAMQAAAKAIAADGRRRDGKR